MVTKTTVKNIKVEKPVINYGDTAVKDMTTDALETEFKSLAQALKPVNKRRMKIAKELENRKKKASNKVLLDSLDLNEKKALKIELDEELAS